MSDHLPKGKAAYGFQKGSTSPKLHALVFAAYVDDETLRTLDEEGPAAFLNVLPLKLDRIIPRVPAGVEDEDDWHLDFWNAMEDIASLRIAILDGAL